VAVEPRVFEVLVYLVHNHDRVVSKEELFQRLWPQQHVSEAALTYAIKAARRVVGDSGKEQRVIKNLHGVGYRFVAPVAEF
jgi:DNA-binding winged helix-turn-helix (wHTH) protein